MTFDFQLAHVCTHLTIEEEVPLGADRRELRTLQPVASASRTRITVNDTVDVPQEGLFTSALLSGIVSGPFAVVANENVLTVSNRTQSVSVEIPIGQRVSTDDVVRLLEAAAANQSVALRFGNVNGYLRVRDGLDEGPRSRIVVSGTAASRVGFTQQTRARGRQVYPPWEFAEREVLDVAPGLSSVRNISSRFPRFCQPVRGNPIFKVTYTTYQQHCRRCQSSGIENDYRIGGSGDPLVVSNEDLLNQGVLKILTTVKGSNPFNVAYGSMLLTRIGSKAVGAGAALITEDVSLAVQTFQRLQTAQGRYQEITPRERLAQVISVRTTPAEFDPTIFEVEVVAANASNLPVVITTVFAAPGTAALAGSNGLSLGLSGLGIDPRTRSIPGVIPR